MYRPRLRVTSGLQIRRKYDGGSCMLSVTVNGEPRAFAAATVAAMVAELGLDLRKVAVERNLEIVPKSRFAETALADGDRIEIVHFIGGG